jgi:hypothetical protein
MGSNVAPTMTPACSIEGGKGSGFYRRAPANRSEADSCRFRAQFGAMFPMRDGAAKRRITPRQPWRRLARPASETALPLRRKTRRIAARPIRIGFVPVVVRRSPNGTPLPRHAQPSANPVADRRRPPRKNSRLSERKWRRIARAPIRAGFVFLLAEYSCIGRPPRSRR